MSVVADKRRQPRGAGLRWGTSTKRFCSRNQHSGGTADLTFMFGPGNASWFPLAGDWDGQ